MNIKAVLFDLGNTLVKTWAPEATIHGVLASLGIDRAVEEIREALLRTEEEFRESGYRSLYGKADYVEYWEKWDSHVLRNLGISGNNYLAREILIRWFDWKFQLYNGKKEPLTEAGYGLTVVESLLTRNLLRFPSYCKLCLLR